MESNRLFPDLKKENYSKAEPISDSIMSAEEYSRHEHPTPYIFELKKEDKTLVYFGTPHLSDPKDPLFIEIEKAFQAANPDIVFIEGAQGNRSTYEQGALRASREEIIEYMGEPGFLLKLAVEKGIEWQCPEPTDEALYTELLNQGFSKEHIFAWEVFQVLPQYLRQIKREGFEPYIKDFITRFKEVTQWKDFDYSYEQALRIGETVLGRSIDVENEPDAIDFVDPIPWEEKKDSQTVFNRIGQTASRFRDKTIVQEIAKQLPVHKRLFILYGASHAFMQEPALRKLFETL